MLGAAEALLEASPDADLSTRDVCERVGVGAPVLYRLFGDKSGLLAAVVDHGFDRYLATKRTAAPSEDPVADLRAGWDSHVAFALEHPVVYRLMYSPSFAKVPSAAAEALRLLREVLDRCAAAGRLRVTVEVAAQAIMAANIGVALSLVSQPERYADPRLSPRVRDAIHASLLTLEPQAAGERSLPVAALQLSALMGAAPPTGLTPAERTLLDEWLTRLAGADER